MLLTSPTIFQLDNFDLLLLIQSIGNVENSPTLSQNRKLYGKLMQIATASDVHVLKQLPRMSIHEFITISNFYLSFLAQPVVCSASLAHALIDKV
jgi:hypothetical protein